MAVRKKRPQRGAQRATGSYLRPFTLPQGLSALPVLENELQGMMDVLMGRAESPVNWHRPDAMLEVANAYYARAQEITAMIQRAERNGVIQKTSGYSKFRTGELRTFVELASKTTELGSRRITMLQLKQEGERTGREQRMD